MREISHPNVIQLIDFSKSTRSGTLYLFLEFVEGGDLKSMLNKGSLPEHVVKRMSLGLA
jgi:serine/threonine protein kinase